MSFLTFIYSGVQNVFLSTFFPFYYLSINRNELFFGTNALGLLPTPSSISSRDTTIHQRFDPKEQQLKWTHEKLYQAWIK